VTGQHALVYAEPLSTQGFAIPRGGERESFFFAKRQAAADDFAAAMRYSLEIEREAIVAKYLSLKVSNATLTVRAATQKEQARIPTTTPSPPQTAPAHPERRRCIPHLDRSL